MSKEEGDIGYSVVIPVFNEEQNILPLYSELKPVMERVGKKYEILFIDDGSTDGTYEAIKKVHNGDNHVKAIRFRKNFGQTAALSAGFDYAKGKVIITMDGDLQNRPDDIPKLLAKMDEGYDVVSGWRYNRKDPKFSKKLPSKLSNRLARRLTRLDLHDFGCTLKAYRRETVNDIELYGDMHRYVPALIAWQGFSVAEVKVEHRPRNRGQTKYGSGRFLRGFFDLINIRFWARYSTRPLHFFGWLGAISFILGFIIGIYKLILRFFYGVSLELGPLLIFAVMLIILGIQFIMFGFLGEIMIRTYYQGKRKIYKVKEVLED